MDGVFTEFMPAAFEARNVFIESQHQAKLFAQRTNEQQARLDQAYSVDLTKFEVVMIALDQAYSIDLFNPLQIKSIVQELDSSYIK